MCGIVGYVGSRNVSSEVLRGLAQLEYRGYDSAGVAVLPAGRGIRVCRSKGKVGQLAEKSARAALDGKDGGLGLGHTRWATHGPPEEHNAHPHLDCKGSLAVVHNGIIENHLELRRRLEREGHRFTSDTDSEVVAHLVESYYEGDLVFAVRRAVAELEGSWALGVIHNGAEPEKIVAARSGSPLVVGLGEAEAYLASDVAALVERTRRVVFLEDGEMAVLRRCEVEVLDTAGRARQPEPFIVTWDAESAKKNGYDHYMRKEIDEQPQALRSTLRGRLERGEDGGLAVAELDRVLAGRLPRRVLITACGTSYHAGLLAERYLESLAGLPTEVDVASELRYRDAMVDDDTLLIAVSQSGETADTLAAVRQAQAEGARVLAVCNVVGSTLAREADEVFYTQAGPEIGVASTKAFTTQVCVLYLVALALASARGRLGDAELAERLAALGTLPDEVARLLENEEAIRRSAEELVDSRAFLFLGRGLGFPIALEGALKLKEISYLPAEGYAAGEMKHGPIALVDQQVPSIFVTGPGETFDKVLANMAEIAARRGPIVAVAPTSLADKVEEAASCTLLPVPDASPELLPLLATITLQLFAYHFAAARGCEIDQPRNLAKSVTVE